MEIKNNLTTTNFSDKNDTKRIKFIVIHYTANNGDTAKGNTEYFKTEYRGASAHYFVDENEVIWRSVTDEDIAWHCGANSYVHPSCRNTNSIGIELCSRKDTSGRYYIKQETIANAVELVKDLMAKYTVPIENVIRHHDVTGKICPEPFVRDITQWQDFKKLLSEKPKQPEQQEEEEEMKRYQTIDEIPDWGKETVKKLVEAKILSGTGAGLDLSEDMLRTLVLTQRMIDASKN